MLARLRELLDDRKHRIITLIGPGGTGKTRLALQAAADQVGRFDDGVFFVDLSEVRDEETVFTTMASTLDVHPSGGASSLDALEQHLQTAEMLLLIDNFEHLAGAATGLVELLEHCPRVTMLVTSQVALRVSAEQLVPVPPLSIPDDHGQLSPSEALEFEAVRFFCQRAATVRPDFELTNANVGDVTAICARLDGLPLAIELAAARINLFGVDELRLRLAERLDVLQGGARDLPERQRTIRNTIEWSTELLTDSERSVLELFSVFAGGRLADVEGVAQRVRDYVSTDVVEAVGSLVDKSLVRGVQGADDRPRFTLLQTIQAYAREQLETEPERADAIRRAHAEHYTRRAVDLGEQLADRGRDLVLAEFADDLGNVRRAWDQWAADLDVDRLNEMLGPLWGYYDARGDYRSTVELGDDLLKVLASQPDSPERARDQLAVELSLARSMLAVRGFTADAEQAIRSVLDHAGPAGSSRERFAPLRSLASLHMLRSDFPRVIDVANELLTIAEREQDPYMLSEAHLVIGMTKMWGAGLNEAIEEIDKSISYLDASDAGFVELRVGPNPAVVSNLVDALMLWMTGFPERSAGQLSHALDIAAELDHPYSVAYALWHASLLDLWRFDLDALDQRADALLRVAEAHDYPVWTALGFVLRGVVAVSRGDAQPGLTTLEQGFTLYEGSSAPPIFWPALLMIRATTYGAAGRVDDGLRFIEEAERSVTVGDPLISDISLAYGDLLLALPTRDAEAAEKQYVRAATLAEHLGSRMVRLQAMTRLATLRRDTPRETETKNELRELLESFTEGHDTPQLAAARAALDS
jgi:predicted ATPase